MRCTSSPSAELIGYRPPCGSELARDSGVSVHGNVDWTTAIVGSPPGASSLPQFFGILQVAIHHLSIEQPLMLQRMGLVRGLAKTVALIGIVVRLDRHAVGL
ncbi:hypothetical protein D3C78_1568330 [compost metagenome]